MDVLAIWLGKATALALRLGRRRGTALPGLVVEKAFPRFLPRQLARLENGVIVVSGTNGKTTTTKMITTILAQQHRVLTNATGGNFVRGTITAVVSAASWRGRVDADIAVFELDEAHAVRFCAVHRPERLLLLNVLRDQLDRFGEIDTTAALLGRVAAQTSAHVVLNRDDPRLVALAGGLEAEVSYFGVAAALRELFPTDDELYGGTPSSSALPAAAELQSVALGNTTELQLRIADVVADISLHAEGAHNAQNAAAAAAVALTTGMAPERIASGLRLVQPAFGRGQSFDLGGQRVVLHLVKNPSGFRQSLRTLDGSGAGAVVLAINDDYADGRDMSWLWDVDFAGPLTAVRPAWLVTSGTRAADIALRLHYDDVRVDEVQPDLAGAVRAATEHVAVDHPATDRPATDRPATDRPATDRPATDSPVVVFSTYTAMWQLHRILEQLASLPGRPEQVLR